MLGLGDLTFWKAAQLRTQVPFLGASDTRPRWLTLDLAGHFLANGSEATSSNGT